ncbi:unnamed protein product [Cercopithifilaria johnstoni]|uniref:Uncharacterized protein n=1 Tax=Cercopithifilaria johnstoni TaxID=2874296 RepID=A0A8J2MT62_9BILA|nr:unnamed protein product [Cercopithifilaria johnstoni]
MFRWYMLSLLLPIITSNTLYTGDVNNLQPFCNDGTNCDYSSTSVLFSSSESSNLIPSHSVSVLENSQQISLYNLWSYLLYRWSIVLYFVPLVVIILCKCKIINCDVRLIYGNMPDDSG